eukprot:scaffold7545_cov79-Skeletonema_dohrnii-CCMP3373.AAC.2
MWRCRQAVQTTAQRWLRRNTSPSSGSQQFARAPHQQHFSVRLYNTSACSITASGQSSLLNRPSILAGSDSHPSLVRYGDVKTSNPLLITSHTFSTRGGKRPRVPQMRDLHSVEEVIMTAYEYLNDMSRRDISAVWPRIALLMTKPQSKQRGKSSHNTGKLSFDDMEHMLYTIFDDTTDGIKRCDMRGLTETTLGMAKIAKTLRQQGKSKREDSRVILRRLLLSKDMKSNEKLFQFLAGASMDKFDRFDARYLSNLAYAYALIDYVPEFDDGSDLFDHIAMNAVDVRAEFNAQELSNMMWAYATVDKPHAALFEAMGDHIVESNRFDRFKPQELSNTVWAFATAGTPHPKLLEKVANHIVSLDSLDRFKPQELSNTVWAYATVQVPKHKLLEKVANHIVESASLGRFKPQELSNTVWAYATARVHHPELFQRVAEAAIQRKTEFSKSQAVANLLWSYSTMGITNKKLFSSFVTTASKVIDSCTNQELSNIAWSYAVADVDAAPLFNDHFIKKCVEKEDGFEIEHLFQLHQWHLWQTKEMSHSGLPVDLQERCYNVFISEEPRVSKFQEDVVAQLSSIGLDPKEEVLFDSGYRIDALVEVNGNQVGIEVDGPYHFIGKGRSPLGRTVLKRRQVPLIDGIELVSVPYWKWDEVGKDQAKKQEYLRNLLSVKSDK